mgnify:CR=1 FL=1
MEQNVDVMVDVLVQELATNTQTFQQIIIRKNAFKPIFVIDLFIHIFITVGLGILFFTSNAKHNDAFATAFMQYNALVYTIDMYFKYQVVFNTVNDQECAENSPWGRHDRTQRPKEIRDSFIGLMVLHLIRQSMAFSTLVSVTIRTGTDVPLHGFLNDPMLMFIIVLFILCFFTFVRECYVGFF